MKPIFANLKTSPVPSRVVLAGLIAVAAYAVSPFVISAFPFGFPPALGPVVMVVVPALALKLVQRRLSLIVIILATIVTNLLVINLFALFLRQVLNPLWLGTVLYAVGYIGVWLGVLMATAWLARWISAQHQRDQQRRALMVAGGLVILVAAGLYGLQMVVWHQPVYETASMSQAQIDERKARIVAIYDSLGLSADYVQTSEDIFGEKRVYAWDKGRSFSSSRNYVRQADVDATVAELRPKIEAAGFTFVGEPYPGSVDIQLHFRSAKGEYIRLTVSSKPRDDALQASRGKDVDYAKLPTGAPSNVLIKVNLDDNNE